MARTKGAKDAKPRRKPDGRYAGKTRQLPGTQLRPDGAAPAPTGPGPAVKQESAPERPRLDDSEFRSAIAAELGQAQNMATPGQDSTDGQAPVSPSAPAASFDPANLTIDGLANAWRLPFYGLARLLAWLRVAPDPEPIEAVGRRHAKTMAKASFPIWDYYARQYVNVHPDQAVNVSIGVTALDGIGIVPDLIDAVGESRRRAAKAAAAAAAPANATPSTAGGAG